MSHSTGLLFANAVSTQQQNAIISQAATTLGVSFLLGGTNSEQDSMKGKK
ncbi:RebB family R body protein [Thalassovita aquimarina]